MPLSANPPGHRVGRPRPQRRRAKELLGWFDLAEAADRLAKTYSGGDAAAARPSRVPRGTARRDVHPPSLPGVDRVLRDPAHPAKIRIIPANAMIPMLRSADGHRLETHRIAAPRTRAARAARRRPQWLGVPQGCHTPGTRGRRKYPASSRSRAYGAMPVSSRRAFHEAVTPHGAATHRVEP